MKSKISAMLASVLLALTVPALPVPAVAQQAQPQIDVSTATVEQLKAHLTQLRTTLSTVKPLLDDARAKWKVNTEAYASAKASQDAASLKTLTVERRALKATLQTKKVEYRSTVAEIRKVRAALKAKA